MSCRRYAAGVKKYIAQKADAIQRDGGVQGVGLHPSIFRRNLSLLLLLFKLCDEFGSAQKMDAVRAQKKGKKNDKNRTADSRCLLKGDVGPRYI